MIQKHSVPIWQIDAFTDRPFTGNPAAVCILDEFPHDQWMQNVAAEMNLAETAFVVPTADDDKFRLRWFTPTTEVDLCGHATLAAAHALIEQGHVEQGRAIRFETQSGELTCQKQGNQLTLDFPATPIVETVAPSMTSEVCEALGLQRALVMRSKFDIVTIVDEAKIVRQVAPDFQRLIKINTRGVIVTSPSDHAEADFLSRFFAPRCGINEDPVTGSSHCCLALYWADRFGRTNLVGHQVSPRGGTVRCQVAGDRVKLAGSAITVLAGHLLIGQM
ncbi:putative isomerase YddE [Planctomycetes bacterium CA13]|uniref:Putative isomerase YddE n=1 Tax=Novipirellula herctigrandis TaxID=2527986 RepID=A0A5C5Z999_9BACT|nr:putative isomerase YddE [Planctomycetes bacterium CA13]